MGFPFDTEECTWSDELEVERHRLLNGIGCARTTNAGHAGCNHGRGQAAFRYTVRRHRFVICREVAPSKSCCVWANGPKSKYVSNTYEAPKGWVARS